MPRKSNTTEAILSKLYRAVEGSDGPAMERLPEANPFKILVACILSLRTKDAVTEAASERLFAVASAPKTMLKLSEDRLAELIYPCGFYRTKAKQILALCDQLGPRGTVPDRLEDLLALPGVGLKTANLVLSLGFGQDAICVDTHVHRISNRLGLIDTRTADESEAALRRAIPRRYWKTLNRVMVLYGQQICQPVSPFCSRCTLQPMCPRRGVCISR